ncbi:MAG: hypothetical protein ACI3XR_01330 [Eubacteriales bacterium]
MFYEIDLSVIGWSIIFYTGILAILVGMFVYLNVVLPLLPKNRNLYKNWQIRLVRQILPDIILLVGIIFIAKPDWTASKGYYDLKHHQCETIEGDVQVLSVEERWYRGTFFGYNVTVADENESISFGNDLPKDVVDLLESDSDVSISYVQFDKNTYYIWRIESNTD